MRTLWVVWGNIRRNRRSFIMASIGLVVGVATGTFFVALGAGVQSEVLNRIYPVNQIEVEPRTVALMGIREQVVDANQIGDATATEFAKLPDVTVVYPKLRSKLQAQLRGGKALFGREARTEAFFDGLSSDMLHAELKEVERVSVKRERRKLRRRQTRCKIDVECPLGQECDRAAETCRDTEYWRRFRYRGVQMPCEGKGVSGAATDPDERCPVASTCSAGFCRPKCGDGGACGAGEQCVLDPSCSVDDGAGCKSLCLSACDSGGGCAEVHEACVETTAGESVCAPIACRFAHSDMQVSERPSDWRGQVQGRCTNGVPWGDPACEIGPCPRGTYCAGRNLGSQEGFCEQPIPVLLSPFIVEFFNSSVSESLGLQRLDGVDALLGFQFRLRFGASYFAVSRPKREQAVKRAEIVGFSNKALDFGVTMPLEYVQAINSRYQGRESSRKYSTFILETEGNEDVTELIAAVQERGFVLARKSRDARKAADLLFILTAVFAFISVVIAGVAAVNIANTFLMMIAERRYEIGIMRAVGATRGDIRRLIIFEAASLGVFGGVLGGLVSYGLSRVVNALAMEHLEVAISKPEDFFVYDGWMLAGAIGLAVLFCIAGALVPANRAASTDPAIVLTS